jgi:hypothetical protein
MGAASSEAAPSPSGIGERGEGGRDGRGGGMGRGEEGGRYIEYTPHLCT